jgi:hypothetical protein
MRIISFATEDSLKPGDTMDIEIGAHRWFWHPIMAGEAA